MPTTLLTGATGHVGHALLPELLAEPGARVLALVRARDAAHLDERLRRLREPLGELGARVEAVAGDVSAPGLGLAAADRAEILARADRVLHCAASVRFDLDEAEASAQNLAATEAVLALATELAEAGRLQRYDHVSTAFVAGDRRGRVYEHECDVGQGFRNSYERSKCRAEVAVRAAMSQGLPACIHRPSIVVGDSRTGATQSFNVLYWPLKIYARGWWRTLPGNPDTLVDLVPVDWVARAMARLVRDPGSVGECVHLAVGDRAPSISLLMARVRSVTGGPPLRVVDQGRYRRLVRPLLWPFFQTARGRAIRRGGDAYLPYCLGNPLFDTTMQEELLPDLPPPDPMEVLETVIRYALARDFGGR